MSAETPGVYIAMKSAVSRYIWGFLGLSEPQYNPLKEYDRDKW